MRQIEIEFSNMPDWVKEQSAKHVGSGKRPICYVQPVEYTAKVGSTWHDGARQVIVARRDGKTVAIQGGYYDSILNHTPEELIGHQGADFNLNKPDDAILCISLFWKLNTITMYIRQDSPHMKLVRVLDEGVELSTLQANVLRHVAGLNSRGRKEERTYSHFPKELVIVVARELQEHGLCKVSKIGSVTVTPAGRRMYRNLSKQEWDWSDWRECHGYARSKGRVVSAFSGFAGEIVSEYRDRMIAERKKA